MSIRRPDLAASDSVKGALKTPSTLVPAIAKGTGSGQCAPVFTGVGWSGRTIIRQDL